VRNATNLCNCRVIYGIHNAEHKICVSSTRRLKPDSPVPAQEEYRGSKDIPRYFDQYLGCKERCPAVHSTRSFADLINRPHGNIGNLYLVHKRGAGSCEETFSTHCIQDASRSNLRTVAMKKDYISIPREQEHGRKDRSTNEELILSPLLAI
jgi:hypothetical protein